MTQVIPEILSIWGDWLLYSTSQVLGTEAMLDSRCAENRNLRAATWGTPTMVSQRRTHSWAELSWPHKRPTMPNKKWFKKKTKSKRSGEITRTMAPTCFLILFSELWAFIPPIFLGKQNKGIKTSKVAAYHMEHHLNPWPYPRAVSHTKVHWGPQTNSRHHLRASHRVSQDAPVTTMISPSSLPPGIGTAEKKMILERSRWYEILRLINEKCWNSRAVEYW